MVNTFVSTICGKKLFVVENGITHFVFIIHFLILKVLAINSV